MADITKCNDEQCSKRLSCYRFTAPADEHWQSYFVNSPRKEDKCEMYWNANVDKDLLRKLFEDE